MITVAKFKEARQLLRQMKRYNFHNRDCFCEPCWWFKLENPEIVCDVLTTETLSQSINSIKEASERDRKLSTGIALDPAERSNDNEVNSGVLRGEPAAG